ncbi:phage baseplate assembly protein [Kaistia dalseonensis]|uniref:Phage baseplate assembly protein V n=1 Tax=Kaistia dalseonensis TaxID=410840 RepID=A0ABU0HCC7_9HYPH|nr:phage baseplate assembly protein [Kaistia dalseonensis]MCX5497332.1 phage baseplate assembly protein [Kaistia dalseonensis]MDQ0439969.1 phage baseplate assembly protein V [Kaistia dalseonensis]
MSRDREIAHAIRALISRAVVRSTDDQGESQTAKLTMAAGVDRTDVEVMQPFGFASRAPAGGAAVVLAIGGDTGDLVLLPISMPGQRLGKLGDGEAAMYALDGTRVHVKADGSIEAFATTKIISKVGEATVEVTADSIKATIGDAEIEMTAEMIRALVGGSRTVTKSGYAKLKSGDNHVVVTPDAIVSSVPIVIGPDPDPST